MRGIFVLVASLTIILSNVNHVASASGSKTCARNAAVVSTYYDGASARLIWSDGLAETYNLTTGALLSSTRLEGYGSTLLSVAFSPDGKFVLAASQDGNVREWEYATGKVDWMLPDASPGIITVAWSPDGKSFLTASHGFQVWDATTGKYVVTVLDDIYIEAAAWSPDSHMILVGGNGDTARLYDASNGFLLRMLSGHSQSVWSAAWSPDGKTAVTTSQDGTIYLWDTTTGNQLNKFVAQKDMIRSVVWSPDSKRILTGGDDQVARIWQPSTGTLLVEFPGHTNVIWNVAWSPDGQTMLTGDLDGTARLWDTNTGELLKTLCSPD